MDYMQQQQWRNPHHLSDHPPSAKIPKLLLDQNQPSDPASATAAAAGLSLSVQQPTNSSSKNSSLSAFPDPSMTSFPRMGIGFFSLAQWKELELQALIFKYILAGAPVPVDLVLRVRKSLLNSTAFYQHYPGFIHPHEFQHYQTAVLQTGCWGRSIVDSEPGRCRRTDGKKWRCSRDVVSGQKYCERHMHRGRNRSRKPVEVPTPSAAANAGVKTNSIVSMPPAEVAKEVNFTLSGPLPSSNDLFHLNQRSSNGGQTESGPYRHINQDNVSGHESCGGSKSDVRVLRHFFDDCPRSQQEPSSTSSTASPATSSTHLSISIQGNPSSDFSLKLSTGDDELGVASGNANDRRTNWTGWGAHYEASMGGPLAEALRSSTSNASPTSVLHKPYGSISETSSICT